MSDSMSETAAYLLESGWELHMSNDSSKQPTLWKLDRVGDSTHLKSCGISHDDVLVLYETTDMFQHRSFDVGNETITVFRSAGLDVNVSAE